MAVKGIKEFKIKDGKFKCGAIGDKNRLVVTGDDNASVNLWSFDENTPIRSYNGFNTAISALKFNQTEEFVIAGSFGGTILIWDYEQQKSKFCRRFISKVTGNLKGHLTECTALAPQQE